ncbi:MAG: hypothetical protein N3B21_05650 [Clostridia bacterium]|nr:hypothetical protein [Clostridia bacterium]
MRDLLLTIVVVHLIMDKLGFASYLRNTDSVLEKSKDDKPL